MAEPAPALTRHDLEAKITKRCWEDEGFRNEFIADPAATFVKYLQVPAASLPKIVAHEEQPGSWHIVLPAKPSNVGELSEDELERIAGGVTPVSAITTVVSVTIVSGASATFVSYTVSRDEGGW
jgi:hypothetical protein